MYKKKISGEQFALDCVNKEFEIIGSPMKWATFEELSAWSKLPENHRWYSNYCFETPEQFWEWKAYFMSHFYDWQPKRVSKAMAEREFSWFNLQYGLKYNFDYQLLYDN